MAKSSTPSDDGSWFESFQRNLGGLLSRLYQTLQRPNVPLQTEQTPLDFPQSTAAQHADAPYIAKGAAPEAASERLETPEIKGPSVREDEDPAAAHKRLADQRRQDSHTYPLQLEQEEDMQRWTHKHNQEVLSTLKLFGNDLASDWYAIHELRAKAELGRGDLADYGL